MILNAFMRWHDMKFKVLLSLFLTFALTFLLVSCDDKKEVDVTSNNTSTKSEEFVSDDYQSEAYVELDTTETVLVSTAHNEENSVTIQTATSADIADPSAWSIEQIIEAYKDSAKKSDSKAKSEQSISLKSISVNNGEYEGLFEFITPIMSKLLANNSTEKDGITGGYKNLSVSDVASAKAYKVGNNIAIEMVMKDQISGAQEDALSGSVGHAITAVGDISVVTQQLTDLGLPLEISEKDTKIYYTKPVVKVLIDKNGEIINGTWSYTVEISLNNYKAFGKTVNTTSVIMDNTITVNGGFKK